MAPRGPKGLLPLIVTMIVSSLIFAACNKNESSMPKTEAEKQVTSPPSAAGSGATSQTEDISQAERSSFMQAAQEDLDKAKSKLEELKTKAQNSSADVKARLEKDIPSLEDQMKTMEKKLADLKNASATSWQEMKLAFSSSMENLKSAINRTSGA